MAASDPGVLGCDSPASMMDVRLLLVNDTEVTPATFATPLMAAELPVKDVYTKATMMVKKQTQQKPKTA